ncbi:MAG: tRNA guanosine(34) transglycosylase Tgt [Bryobacterales bacterium]|nr:tRNA guanosine(34) transglycosylase Tgt [Bryobacterales bacterium]
MSSVSARTLDSNHSLTEGLRFELQAQCPETGARAGLLHTAHGTIETPVFMPVGTQGTVKGLTPAQLERDLDAKIILSNTYHLFLRPGHELIRDFGGLHEYIRWPRAILTDSGGFQVFSLSKIRKVTEQGVVFHSHLNGDKHLFTPESTVDVQRALGSDIMMVLDECLEYPPPSMKEVRQSMQRTIRWAGQAFRHYRHFDTSRQALFPIVQGAMSAELRVECAEKLLELNAPGYAIGGLSVGEPREESLAMTEITTPLLPREKPRYVMGVGKPEELIEYVARGVDMMDCVMPSRNARNGCLFTSEGKVIIKNSRYRDDRGALDPACSCYTCRNFSKSYLRHLFLAGEILFSVLGTLHNMRHYLDIMRRIRQSILLGEFPELLRTRRIATVVGTE